MSSETDPLLPSGNSAPEVTGYGFSKPSEARNQPRNDVELDEDERDRRQEPSNLTGGGASPLRTLIALFTIVVGLALVITLLVPGALDTPGGKRKDDTAVTNRERAMRLLSNTPLIDGHNDFAFLIRYLYHNKIYQENFTRDFENGDMPYHVDLPRLKAGKVGGAFWSAFIPCPAYGLDFSDGNYAETVAMTYSQLDLIKRLTAKYSDEFSPSELNSTSALASFKDHQQLVSPIGIEGLHQIGNSISNLRIYHSLGVRYATLCHNCHNNFADAALVDESGELIAAPPYWGGLSKRGQLTVREMNRMGMLIDLAHVSKDTMLDVLGGRPEKGPGSLAPVIFSHSSVYALCPHPRNVPDDVLQLVKKTKSIVMVNFSPDFISCVPSDSKTGIPDLYPKNSTLHQVARHITYIGDLIGYDHVGLGSDFDGIPTTPEGLEDVSKFPDLVAELLRMGVSDGDAAKIVGLNVLRVWGDAEMIASKMQREGVLPLEDTVERLTGLH